MIAPLRQAVLPALLLQTVWALCSSVWNVAGITLLATGQRALGPNASLEAAMMLIGFTLALWAAAWRWPLLYAVLTSAAGMVGLSTVLSALTADPTLWASEFWRIAAAILNGGGFMAAVWAMFGFVNWSDRVTERPRAVARQMGDGE
jgi:hypothetical protein